MTGYEKALTRYAVVPETGCWEWTGKRYPNGYGALNLRTHPASLAHRFMYEHHVGPIPAGLDLDHLCRNRACVNPAHLEPVTRRENLLRGAHPNHIAATTGICRRGHRLVQVRRDSGRMRQRCNVCANDQRMAKYRAKAAERRAVVKQVADTLAAA